MKIILIGGAGFLGSALVPKLLANNHQIIILGRSEKPKNLSDNISYIQTKCDNAEELLKNMSNAEVVIDFSYTTTPKTSFDDPIADLTSNLPRVITLFEVCKQITTLQKLIIISSGGTIYGTSKKFPIKETAQTKPVSPYGITKLTIEKYAHMYHELYGLPVVIARPANAYGPKNKINNVQGFINVCLKNVLNNTKTVIFGEHGTIRDYIYIDDIAEALLAILNNGVAGRIYNIGTGKGKSNLEILQLISAVVKKDNFTLDYDIKPQRPFDVPINILDFSQLKKDTNWKPKTSIKDGIQKTWDYMFSAKNK